MYDSIFSAVWWPVRKIGYVGRVDAAVVVVVNSPQTPEDDTVKRLRTQWETCRFIDGHPKVQLFAVRVKGGSTEPRMSRALR